ncbi:hypothetical protein PVAP13_8NG137900 [Panicum virgatum]|uniref:Uncharacterized protein n=1 Tax=Panicum virgatum TaxID=38727 RepID=A0A8T0P7M1_PANVG|nr:hypothetical protein PVAP13_8NG137900 [Panicum virgatum]KAG2558161.1 hypothetical protein PVAP13_8NG137900 [Panicum virgatum]KAG2558162.1 hypothetical protein PVAP13_8NG137900 [Panicum virgatum]
MVPVYAFESVYVKLLCTSSSHGSSFSGMIYKGTVHNGVAVHNGVSSSKCNRVGAKSIMQVYFKLRKLN